MGRRNDWSAVRMVAEDIAAGEQWSWQLARNVHHPSSGWEAIKELEGKGLITVAGYEVKPTPAFRPWLEELQSAETAQALARQRAISAPWEMPAPTREPSKPLAAAVPAVPDVPSTRSYTRKWCFSNKYGRPRITNREFMCEHEMSLRILDFMRHHEGYVTSSNLRRGLNAYRYPELYESAFQKLQSLKALKVEKEPGTRRQWVTLRKIPRGFEVTRPKPKRRQRHKPRSRGQTTWFQQFMAEQELEDCSGNADSS